MFYWLKNLDSVPRRFLSIGLAILVFLILPALGASWKTRLLATWSAGVVCFLVLIFIMMIGSNPEKTRARAQRRQANPKTLFGLVIFTAFASLFTIGLMLASGKDKFEQLSLSVVAIICSWLLTHTTFALNYARYYYDDDSLDPHGGDYAGGLDFPTEDLPDYLDFMYFAFTISMTSQTSDVSITSRPLRRLVLAHELVSFFFYSVIIGFVVNSIGNLI